jgi:spore coat polysaccharide biosynthesis protein SpsF
MSVPADILTLVAVRLKSTRLPGKALADLAGKPLIQRLTERVVQAKHPKVVYWCTSTNSEDDPLETLAETSDAWIYRGDELDVISRFVEVAWSRNSELVVRVTGDNPLTDPSVIDFMIEEHRKNDAEYTYCDELPRGTRSEIISVSALEKCHSLVEDPGSSEYMTHMLRRPDHFKVLKVDPPQAQLNRPEIRLTCDEPADLEVLRRIFDAFDGAPPPLTEIIAWLDDNEDVTALNSYIQPIEIDETINIRLKGD